ncbi:GntR family transcriptional regulator [Pseudooceanicola nanhaiensis]|uniref:GntR family transcriptional regulator n=1 Tax=Pseudooceanicola nanhaiensis TaxID=375761 RepID=UPI001CD49975|nr:GntR family transcriptional regulator [Pseudooceanicola nanhaiensis]MCA0922492.1 GntR family transcriptional regulator [Pseudooceanicola nanhaiensis]
MAKETKPAKAGTPMSSSHRAHAQLREQLLRSKFLPGQKINEVEIATSLEISRTPLREALNRLVAEGLLVDRGRGFSVPGLEPEMVFDLFEARVEIECATVRLACERAEEAELEALSDFLKESMAESPDASVDRLIELDIRFHDTIAELARNKVLRQTLSNLNDRIHLIRWIAMEGRRERTQSQHREILDHIRARDTAGAIAAMREHILHRNEDILEAIKAAYGHVYTRSSA